MKSFNNIVIKLMAAFFLLPLVILSQSNILKEEFNKSTGILNKPNSVRTLSYIDNKIIYYFDAFNATQGKNIIVNRYNIETENSFEHLTIEVPKSFKKLNNEHVYSFAVQKSIIVLLTDEFVYIGKLTGLNKAKIIKAIKNQKYSYQKVMQLNADYMMLYVYYNYHPLDSPIRHVWAKLNLTSLEIESVKYQNEEEANFTQTIKNWVTTYKGLIANANTTKYCIKLYKDDFTQCDSIQTNFFDENKQYMNLFNGKLGSKDALIAHKKRDDSLLTRIEKIVLLDSVTLLVNVKLPKQKDFEVHLWRKLNSKWEFVKKEIIASFYKEGVSYNESNNMLNPLFGNHVNITISENKFMYIIIAQHIPNIVTNSFDMQKDYVDVINDMALKNKLYHGIKKYKLIY